MAASVEIRPLTTPAECAEAVFLQRQIWGAQPAEELPVRLFLTAGKIGGQVLGAFARHKMVAFCLCIPGIKHGDNRPYLHSHILGVSLAYRNTGLGRLMKWQQREFALAQKIDLIEWTVDPLELKNAFFNIERLGAVVRRQVRNQYGATTSPLHGGLPTDRLIAEWWLLSQRVDNASQRRPHQLSLPIAALSLPTAIAQIRRNQPVRARDLQADLMAQFGKHFAAGLAVVGFSQNETEGSYLLGNWEPPSIGSKS